MACVLAGCSAPAIQETIVPDASATARLDLETGEIVMPLSEYDVADSHRDFETFSRAVRVFVGECMEARGFPYSAAAASDEDRIVDDRPYGIWFEPNARVYGFGFAPSAVDAALEDDMAADPADWAAAEQQCGAEAETDPELGQFRLTNELLNDSLVPRIRTEAYRLAAADPAWQAAREGWWECLREEGLTPLTGPYQWGTEQDGPVEIGADGTATFTQESVQVAHLQAQCNNQTGLTQTLADLEASYQAALIDRHEAALGAFKTDKQDRLEAAREYIVRHG